MDRTALLIIDVQVGMFDPIEPVHAGDRLLETLADLATEYCVDTTVRSAFARGYKIALAANGHSTWGDGVLTVEQVVAHHNRTLLRFAEVTPAADVQF